MKNKKDEGLKKTQEERRKAQELKRAKEKEMYEDIFDDIKKYEIEEEKKWKAIFENSTNHYEAQGSEIALKGSNENSSSPTLSNPPQKDEKLENTQNQSMDIENVPKDIEECKTIILDAILEEKPEIIKDCIQKFPKILKTTINKPFKPIGYSVRHNKYESLKAILEIMDTLNLIQDPVYFDYVIIAYPYSKKQKNSGPIQQLLYHYISKTLQDCSVPILKIASQSPDNDIIELLPHKH